MCGPCELCGGSGPWVPVYPRLGIVRCAHCGLVFYAGPVDPTPLYDRAYFHGREYRDYLADGYVWQRNFQARIRYLRKLRPAGRLLEIGCAYGLFLQLAARHWEVRGIDVAADAVAYARHVLGLNAVCADFLTLADEPESCDIVCLWDTLEHLPRPVRTLEKAARWLKPGGILTLTTNDIGSLVARWRGEKWRQLHPPTHLFYFSRATLRRAVAQAGLATVHVACSGQYRSWRSMVETLCARRGAGGRAFSRLLTLGGRFDFPVYLNTRDIVLYTARKPAPAVKSNTLAG